MHTTNYKEFKGEIENYVNNGNNIFESRIDHAFVMLKIRTNLSRTKIKKKDGLVILPRPSTQKKPSHIFRNIGRAAFRRVQADIANPASAYFSLKDAPRMRLTERIEKNECYSCVDRFSECFSLDIEEIGDEKNDGCWW